MAIKLSSLRISKKITKWVCVNSYFSSLSCANETLRICEIDQNPPNCNDFEGKIEFLKNSRLYPDTLIRVLDSTRNLDCSLKLFKWASVQKRFKHNVDTYFWIISKLGVAGMVEEMEGFCREMVKEQCSGSGEVLLELIDLFFRENRLDEALRVLGILNSGKFFSRIGLYNSLLGALLREKKELQSVLFVYKEMVKAGIVPNVETLNYLLEALFEADQIDVGLDQYRRMRKKGCCPNSRTFEIVITSLIDRDRENKSLVLLGEMFDVGCALELEFYTCVIPQFCKINKLEVGMQLFEMMRASKIVPDLQTYEVLVQYLCEDLLVNDAIDLLDEMESNNLTPSNQVFVDIINGFCALNKLNEAKKFFEGRHVLDSQSYNALLEAYCIEGNFPEAKKLFDRMVEMSIADTMAWKNIFRCVAQTMGSCTTLEFLGKLIVFSFLPEFEVCSALIIGKCKVGKPKEALELFIHVRARCWVLDSFSYAKLVECLCQMENFHEAVEVFCYMSSKSCTLLSSSFDMLVAGLCKTEKVDSAIRLLSLTCYSGTSCSNASYNAILRGLSKSQKIECLLLIISRMIVEGCALDVDTYCILIESTCQVGRTVDCILILNIMVSKGLLPEPETLDNLLSFLAKQSQIHTMLAAIWKFMSKQEIHKPTIYNTLINGLWKEGYKSEACRLLDVMLEKGWVPDVNTHRLLTGSSTGVVKENQMCTFKNFQVEDNISNILMEGLTETQNKVYDQPIS